MREDARAVVAIHPLCCTECCDHEIEIAIVVVIDETRVVVIDRRIRRDLRRDIRPRSSRAAVAKQQFRIRSACIYTDEIKIAVTFDVAEVVGIRGGVGDEWREFRKGARTVVEPQLARHRAACARADMKVKIEIVVDITKDAVELFAQRGRRKLRGRCVGVDARAAVDEETRSTSGRETIRT